MKIKCVILGAGGHSKVLLDCLETNKSIEIINLLDADVKLKGKNVSKYKVLGGDEMLPQVKKMKVTHFIIGVGSVGNSTIRQKLFNLGIEQGLQPLSVIHPSAVISPSAIIGVGTVVFPMAVVNAGAIIGRNVIINTGAVVEHDCKVFDHVHLSPKSCLASTVIVGKGSHIGAGAVVKQLVKIGENAVVGMGAVVLQDVYSNQTVVGNPARELKK
ncbi:MAG: acetyltransferase [Elusimicrobiota bacterium]